MPREERIRTRAFMRFPESRPNPSWHKNARPRCGDIIAEHLPQVRLQPLASFGFCDYFRLQEPCVHEVFCGRCGVVLERFDAYTCPERRRSA